MIVDISDGTGAFYFFGGDYEPATANVIRKLVRPADVVCDVGANVGYFTFLAADIIGASGHVHSFEPNPNLSKVCRDSIAMNSYEGRITLNQLAVSDKSAGAVEFYMSMHPQNSGLSSLRLHAYGMEHGFFSPSSKILVRTSTLGDYFDAHGIEKCRLIKIDVESAEYDVITGMRGLLQSNRVDFIVCETTANEETDILVRRLGFDAYAITENGLHRVQNDSKFWGNVLYVSPGLVTECPAAIQALILAKP
jgi:FkbM family methyltransferase